MGAAALRYDPMEIDRKAASPDTPLDAKTQHRLATEAVRSVAPHVEALGGRAALTDALYKAMTLSLVGQKSQARVILEQAGYPNDIIEATIQSFADRAASAA